MSLIRTEFRTAFLSPTQTTVRVTKDGFRIHDEYFQELVGRIKAVQLVRKLFEGGRLECDSPDGIEARTGIRCDECRHPRCRPLLRIHLEEGSRVFVIDLATTSARNLLALNDELEEGGLNLENCPLLLSIHPKTYWAEIRFLALDDDDETEHDIMPHNLTTDDAGQ